MTTTAQISANRFNARKSTGPRTLEGKRRVGLNAVRHGVLSANIILAREDRDEFRALLGDLHADLAPVGALEVALIERIAVCIWRQRRLVRAEAATLDLELLDNKIAVAVTRALDSGSRIKEDDLEPFDTERIEWCRDVLAEYESLGDDEAPSLSDRTPLIRQQLEEDANEDGETVEQHLAHHDGGLVSYVAELVVWCHEELRRAERNPKIVAVAERARAKAAILPAPALEVLARYQTALDNQLAKAMRALKEAQAWRAQMIEASPVTADVDSAVAA